jgi:calcineurin-like phosphoesterase family protein
MDCFTSDTHFGHANIIRYCNRPYATVEEMDEALIQNWNSVVQPEDNVYHLGDIFFKMRKGRAFEILDRLNGNIHLIYGNHDHLARELNVRFVWKKDYFELRYPSNKIILSHYAFRVWNSMHHGTWHLYGHSHGTLPDDLNSLSFDAGVDVHGYKPITLTRVAEIMATKKFVPKDHHGTPESEELERKRF